MGSSLSVLGIDPGASKSGWVLWNGKEILDKGIYSNDGIIEMLDLMWSSIREPIILAIESMSHIHIPKTGRLKGAGKDICDTLRWEGEFYRAWKGQREYVPGHVIKKALGAKDDPGIRIALIQRFGAPGNAKHPGFTYELRKEGYHLYRAFSVAVVWLDHLEFQARELK